MAESSTSKPKRKTWIARQFAARPIEMLESPAMRVLSLADRRILDRIEIEHAHHGGADNGKLPITYVDFERFGVHPNAIAPSLRVLEALGFIETTRKGYSGPATMRAPSLYRLTYRPTWNATKKDGDGTHEYIKITTIEQAEGIASCARKAADPRNVAQRGDASPQGRQRDASAKIAHHVLPLEKSASR